MVCFKQASQIRDLIGVDVLSKTLKDVKLGLLFGIIEDQAF
jgi:hypothetical protein